MTDLSMGNPLVKSVSIWAAIAEMLGYYVDNNAQESFLSTCTLYKSAVLHAEEHDYRVHLCNAAQATVQFYVADPAAEQLVMPVGTIVADVDEKIKYQTTEEAVIESGDLSSNIVLAIQKTRILNAVTFSGTGLPNQVFEFVSSKVVDGTATVTIDGDTWDQVDTFAYSNTGSQHCMLTVNGDANVVLKFGDGVLGAAPALGSEIVLDVDICDGVAGNDVVIWKMVGVLPTPPAIPVAILCQYIQAASGGTGYETISELQKRVPIFHRTKKRIITLPDFKDVTETFPGVLQSEVYYQESMNWDVWIYVVMTSGGMAIDSVLADIKAYLASCAVWRAKPTVFNAGKVLVSLTASINVSAGYSRTQAIANAKANLLALYAPVNQKISGTIYLSDLYQTIEDSDGIENSNISDIRIAPYARPLGDSPELNLEVSVVNSSVMRSWRIIMATSNTFQVFRDGSFIGTYSTDNFVTLTEVTFKIRGTYAAYNEWNFCTYPNILLSGRIALNEMSIPAMNEADINLIASGGVI